MSSAGIVPTRAVVALMIFTACFISYMLRVNISINLIAMVEPVASGRNGTQSECVESNDNRNSSTEGHEKLKSSPDYGIRYEWDSTVQGLLLGSYFWGYILTSIPGGILAERYGPTRVVGITGLLSAILTTLTPLAASWHYGVVIAFRVVLGLLGGVVYPALHCLVARWAPPVEKGKFMGALMGGTFGTVVTWPLLGIIIENIGWTWAFFIPGAVSFIWSILWFLLVADSPDVHSRINEEEKMYIVKSLGDAIKKEKRLPPYKDICMSVPFWALTILHYGNVWGLYLLITSGPKYISEALGFNLGHSGFLAALPHLARLLAGFVFGSIGDVIRKNTTFSVTSIRKSFVTFSHIIPGLFLLAQTAIGCDKTLAIAFLTLALGFNGASTLTNLQNSQDLAPNFAGTLYGTINCVGGTTGFLTPMLTGYITEEHSGLHEWHVIFWIGGSIYIATGLFYAIFGSGNVQYWNDLPVAKATAAPFSGGVENPAFSHHLETKSENTKV